MVATHHLTRIAALVVSAALLTISDVAPANQLSLTALANMVTPFDVVTDAAGPASQGSVVAHTEIPYLLDCDGQLGASAAAAANDVGVTAVRLSGRYRGVSESTVQSSTDWSTTIVNDTGEVRTYFVMFTIQPAVLKLYDPVGHGDTEKPSGKLGQVAQAPPETGFDVDLRLDGAPIFAASATLFGGTAGHSLVETGTDLGGAFSMPDAQTLRYDFSQHTQSIVLGTYPPGQGFTFRYLMSAFTVSPGSNVGAETRIGDPLDLDSTPGITVQIVTSPPVAVAGTVWGAVKERYR